MFLLPSEPQRWSVWISAGEMHSCLYSIRTFSSKETATTAREVAVCKSSDPPWQVAYNRIQLDAGTCKCFKQEREHLLPLYEIRREQSSLSQCCI